MTSRDSVTARLQQTLNPITPSFLVVAFWSRCGDPSGECKQDVVIVFKALHCSSERNLRKSQFLPILIGDSHDGQIYVCHLVAMVI